MDDVPGHRRDGDPGQHLQFDARPPPVPPSSPQAASAAATTVNTGTHFARFDMGRSGAVLAWDYFFGGPSTGRPRPWIVEYVQDRDLWAWKLPRSKEVSAYLRSLEANFSISSPDANGDGIQNLLEPFDPMAMAGARGLSMEVSVNKLTLRWDPAQALMSTDAADPIRSLTYGGLDGVVLRPVSGLASDAVALDALFGAPSITVTVTP